MKKLVVLLLGIFLLVGCSNKSDNLISYMDAKEKIINENAVLLDVRSADEYNEKHLSGAVLLALNYISEDNASIVIEDKDTPVIVYCRSGNRSAQAVTKLKELGYTDVYDLGSMDNWKEE